MKKEKLIVCYQCRTKSNKDELIRIETNKKTKQGLSIFRYYHPECLQVSKVNKSKKERRTSAFSNESVSHVTMKESIYSLLKDGNLVLIDQFNNKIKFNSNTKFIMESPVTLQHQNIIPYYSEGSCNICFDEFGIGEYVNNILINEDQLDERVLACRESEDIHPCIKCPFNKLKYISIFDIGIIEDNRYIGAIEILRTSKTKKYKLEYCIKNNIPLYEIKTDIDISNNVVNCNKLWWKKENGQIKVIDTYED